MTATEPLQVSSQPPVLLLQWCQEPGAAAAADVNLLSIVIQHLLVFCCLDPSIIVSFSVVYGIFNSV